MEEKDIIKILNKYKSVYDDCISPDDFKNIAKDIIKIVTKSYKEAIDLATNVVTKFWIEKINRDSLGEYQYNV